MQSRTLRDNKACVGGGVGSIAHGTIRVENFIQIMATKREVSITSTVPICKFHSYYARIIIVNSVHQNHSTGIF